MRAQFHDGPSLFSSSASRKYLNGAERRRFLESTQQLPSPERLFCEVLALCGARISEVLALTPAAIDIESGVVSIRTLKRRKRGVVRQRHVQFGYRAAPMAARTHASKMESFRCATVIRIKLQ
jgi:integrase/recombinase XerD